MNIMNLTSKLEKILRSKKKSELDEFRIQGTFESKEKYLFKKALYYLNNQKNEKGFEILFTKPFNEFDETEKNIMEEYSNSETSSEIKLRIAQMQYNNYKIN